MRHWTLAKRHFISFRWKDEELLTLFFDGRCLHTNTVTILDIVLDKILTTAIPTGTSFLATQ